MTNPKQNWVKELPIEIMVCDAEGTILEMNAGAEALFAEDGGLDLLGQNVLGCHPEPSHAKLAGMMEQQLPNTYYFTKNGKKTFVFQSPWYKNGQYAGFVEISFAVPDEIPHFVRG